MSRSRIAIVLTVCVAFSCAFASAVSAAAAKVCDFAQFLAPEPVAAEPVKQAQVKPRTKIAAARSFVARLMRRERPALSPGWRMCPSV